MNKHTKQAGTIFLALMMLSSFVCGAAADLLGMVLPASLKIIREEAFYGNTSIEKVIVPDGTTEIRGRAFADSSMTELVLPGSLTYIAEDAFEGCGDITITVPEHCYAYNRCIELGLIERPEVSQMESAHPYADDFDYTWTYDAGEGTESVTITFSADTETEEDYDFIYIYTLNDVEVGKYSGIELAGKSVTIDGDGFKLRLTSDEAWGGGNAYYGFRLESIVPKKAVPLHFESITAESSAVAAGETIRWTVAATGGKAPVYYDYTVLLGEEEVATGTVEAPNTIEYTPVRAGEYKLSVIARDSADVVLPAQVSDVVTVMPSTAYPESAHPYAANTDQSWVYAAEENVESLTVTFSEETKTESRYDYIYLYDQNGTQIGKYSGTELAGQTIEIQGSAFTIRLTSDSSSQYHGFTITSIEKYIPGPLRFVSLTVDKSKAKTGELITWTMETEGGSRPVTYEYTVTLNNEIVYSGSVIRPEAITYVPMEAGDYTMSVVAKDADNNTLPAQTNLVRITQRETTSAEYFTYEMINGLAARITGYTGTDTVVSIPNEIDGYIIEEIASNVFKNNTDIISVFMPASLQTIGSSVFYGCTNLLAVDMEEGLTTIEDSAFKGCTNLKGINIPDGLIYLGPWAFCNCTSLRQMVLPDSIEQLGHRAFSGCENLESINIPKSWKGLGSYNSVYYDGGYVFEGCKKLTSITIPEGMTVLPGLAFDSCKYITTIHLPNSLVELGANCLSNCTGITEITLPDSLTQIGNGAFSGCTNLKEINIPDGLTYLGPWAFSNCTSLRQMVLPDSIEQLGHRAFSGCENLESINIPKSWKGLGSYNSIYYDGGYVFSDCKKLTSIIVPEGMTVLPKLAFDSCTYITTVHLPNSLVELGANCLSNCTGITEITLPDSLTQIGNGAFSGCTNLKEINIPDGLTYLGPWAFSNCTSLRQMVLPDSIEQLGHRAFSGCENLESINIPKSWKGLGSYNSIYYDGGYVFAGCKKLTSITVPEGMTVLPELAFDSCTYITTVHLPNSLVELGANCFSDCTGITEITLPNLLASIKSKAFSGCTNLKKIYIPPMTTSIQDKAFDKCTNLKIYCEYGSVALQYAIDNGIPYFYLSLVNSWLPSDTIYMGDDNHIGGMIRSSDPIIWAEVKLFDTVGNVLRSGKVSNDATLINLGVYLDGCISLSTLPLGAYSIEVSAATEEEGEVFARTSFNVAAAPLRLKLTGDSLPNGLYDIGAAFMLKGQVQSNYAITSITAGIYDKNGAPTEMVATVSPNTTSYDLSNLAATAKLEDLKDGKYSYQIRATSNGQTRLLKKTTFGMGTADGEGIDDAQLKQMLKFVEKPENILIFAPLTYHETYLKSLSGWEIFQVLLVSGKDIAIQEIGNFISGNSYSAYAVDLYKANIVRAVESQIESGGVDVPDLKLSTFVSKWMENSGQAIHLGLKAYMQSAIPDNGVNFSAATYAGAMMMAEMVDTLGQIHKDMENLSDACKYVEQLFDEYETGARVIESVVEMMNVSDNENFNEAVRQVQREYNDRFLKVGRSMMKDAINKVIKGLLNEALKEIMGKGTFAALGIAKDIAFELTGLKEHANNTMAFVTATEAFNNAERAYRNAFELVSAGDKSEEALRRLLICFNFTYSCADNLYYTLYDLSPASKKAEVLSHINGDLRPISIWK